MKNRTPYAEITLTLIRALGHSGLLAYARSLGIVTVSEVRKNDTIGCYAILREGDTSASAWINLNTGRYGDSGGDHKEIYLWEVAARLGKAPTYQEAREHLAQSVGLTFKRGRLAGGGGFSPIAADHSQTATEAQQPLPLRKPLRSWLEEVHPEREKNPEQVQKVVSVDASGGVIVRWPDPVRTAIEQFCSIKKGFNRESVVAAGGFYSTWPHGRTRKDGDEMDAFKKVVGVPVYGQAILSPTTTTLDDSHAVGAVIWQRNAQPFRNKIENPKPGEPDHTESKMKTVVTGDGLIGDLQTIVDDRARVARGEPSQIDHIRKVEGPTDYFALRSITPPELRARQPIISTAGGSKSVSPWTAEFVRGYIVYTFHDLDTAGQDGALKTCETWGPTAKAIYPVKLEGEITGKHGADVRDRIIAGKQIDYFDSLMLFLEPFQVTDAHRQSLAKMLANQPSEQVADAAPKKAKQLVFGNGIPVEDDFAPKSLPAIDRDLRTLTNNQPMRVGNLLFVHPSGTREVVYLPSTALLFSHIGHVTNQHCQWSKGNGFPSKEELYAYQSLHAPEYQSAESLPHYPPLLGHYYAWQPKPGDGSKLRGLLDRFRPATDVDRELILAAIVTLFWGGGGGCRPMIVITSPDGRGVGKSSAVKFITLPAGGFLDVGQNEEISDLKTRLLSDEGMSIRAVCRDNVKTHRFSSETIEAAVTSPTISGKRLFRGEGRRPNTVTWFVTLNGPSLSRDLAQRSVFIHLRTPVRSGTWEEDTTKFILDNRDAIVADIAAFFEQTPAQLTDLTRWASWEQAVLARLPNPAEAQRAIRERQAECDVDSEESLTIEDHFADRLRGLNYIPETESVFIPSKIAADWYSEAVGERKSPVAVSRMIKQGSKESILRFLQISECRTHGRGVLWKCDDPTATLHYDIIDRIELQRVSQLKADARARRDGALGLLPT